MAISQRAWTAAGCGAAVLIVGLTYFVGIGPARSHTSSVRASASAAEQANNLLQIKINGLRKQAAGIDGLTTQLAADLRALPSENNLAGLTRELNGLAAANDVSITSIAPSAPSAGAGSAAPAVVTAGPVGTIYNIPISLVVSGGGTAELGYLKALQTTEERAILVNTVTMSSGTNGASTMTIAAQVFLAPKSAADEAAIEKEIAAAK